MLTVPTVTQLRDRVNRGWDMSSRAVTPRLADGSAQPRAGGAGSQVIQRTVLRRFFTFTSLPLRLTVTRLTTFLECCAWMQSAAAAAPGGYEADAAAGRTAATSSEKRAIAPSATRLTASRVDQVVAGHRGRAGDDPSASCPQPLLQQRAVHTPEIGWCGAGCRGRRASVSPGNSPIIWPFALEPTTNAMPAAPWSVPANRFPSRGVRLAPDLDQDRSASPRASRSRWKARIASGCGGGSSRRDPACPEWVS